MFQSSSQQPPASSPHILRRDFLKTGVALAAGLPSLSRIHAAEVSQTVKLGDAPQLFVDLTRVEKLDNVIKVKLTNILQVRPASESQ